MNRTIPLSFIRARTDLSWSEAAWGFHHGLFDWRGVVDLACDVVSRNGTDESALALASVLPSGSAEVGVLLDTLAARVPNDPGNTKLKWLFLLLAWLFENRNELEDPLGTVEEVYADFDYPDEIKAFVRYMPSMDGYDPIGHSLAENSARLMSIWQEWVTTTGKRFKGPR